MSFQGETPYPPEKKNQVSTATDRKQKFFFDVQNMKGQNYEHVCHMAYYLKT